MSKLPDNLEAAEIRIVSKNKKEFTILIDAEDFEKVSGYNWRVHIWNKRIGYATASLKRDKNGKRKYLIMHRLIMGAPSNKFVDHINGNTLDNRKCNLRIATPLENSRNRLRLLENKTVMFKGVSLVNKLRDQTKNVYKTCIKYEGKNITIGTFDNAIDAAIAYDNAAIKYFKEFAALNFTVDRIEKMQATKLLPVIEQLTELATFYAAVPENSGMNEPGLNPGEYAKLGDRARNVLLWLSEQGFE